VLARAAVPSHDLVLSDLGPVDLVPDGYWVLVHSADDCLVGLLADDSAEVMAAPNDLVPVDLVLGDY